MRSVAKNRMFARALLAVYLRDRGHSFLEIGRRVGGIDEQFGPVSRERARQMVDTGRRFRRAQGE